MDGCPTSDGTGARCEYKSAASTSRCCSAVADRDAARCDRLRSGSWLLREVGLIRAHSLVDEVNGRHGGKLIAIRDAGKARRDAAAVLFLRKSGDVGLIRRPPRSEAASPDDSMMCR